MEDNSPMINRNSNEDSGSENDDKILPLIDPKKKRIRKKKFTYSNPSGEMLNQLENQRSKGFFKRNFGTLKGGSLRAVVIYWIRMTTGIGIMALPYFFSQLGLLMGSILVTLAAIMSYFSFKYIFIAQIITGKKDLVQIARKFIPNWMASIYSYTLIFDVLSAMIIYTVVSWNLFSYLLAIFGFAKDEWIKDKNTLEFNEYNKEVLIIRAIFLHVVFLCLIPLLLKRSLESLKWVSQIFLASLIFIVIVLLAQTPIFYNTYHKNEDPTKNTSVSYFYKSFFKLKTFSYLFSIILAFYVQSMIMSLRKELLVPNIKRLKKVSYLSVGLELILFLILGIVCYSVFGDSYTTKLIILRKPLDGYLAFEWVFRVGLISFFLSNVMGIPIYNVPLRDSIIRKINYINENSKMD
jgi:amino acid permease